MAPAQTSLSRRHSQATATRLLAPLSWPTDTLGYLSLSLKRQWKRYRRGLRRCQRKFSAAAVHESRVETRRLLSLLELLRPFAQKRRVEKALASLKRHLDMFDDLRDTQVQLLALGGMSENFPGAVSFLKYLRKREERFERQTRKSIKRVKTRQLAELIADCRREVKAWLKADPAERANSVLLLALKRAFARTLELKTRLRREDPRSIHRTRVAFKKYRYMVELLADRLPGADEKLLAAMHEYQTMMGEIQDAEVLLQTLDVFLAKKRLEPEAGRQLRAECLRRRRRLVRVYLDAADQLFEFQPDVCAARISNGPGARRFTRIRPQTAN